MQSRSQERHKKQTFKTFQLHEKMLFIRRHKSELKYDEKKVRKMHVSRMNLKKMGFECSNIEAWLLFAPSLSKFLFTRLPVGFIQLSFPPWLETIITPLVCRLHKFSVSNACVFLPVGNDEMWIT